MKNFKKSFFVLFFLSFSVCSFRSLVSMGQGCSQEQHEQEVAAFLKRGDTERLHAYLTRLNFVCSVLYLQKQFFSKMQEFVRHVHDWLNCQGDLAKTQVAKTQMEDFFREQLKNNYVVFLKTIKDDETCKILLSQGNNITLLKSVFEWMKFCEDFCKDYESLVDGDLKVLNLRVMFEDRVLEKFDTNEAMIASLYERIYKILELNVKQQKKFGNDLGYTFLYVFPPQIREDMLKQKEYKVSSCLNEEGENKNIILEMIMNEAIKHEIEAIEHERIKIINKNLNYCDFQKPRLLPSKLITKPIEEKKQITQKRGKRKSKKKKKGKKRKKKEQQKIQKKDDDKEDKVVSSEEKTPIEKVVVDNIRSLFEKTEEEKKPEESEEELFQDPEEEERPLEPRASDGSYVYAKGKFYIDIKNPRDNTRIRLYTGGRTVPIKKFDFFNDDRVNRWFDDSPDEVQAMMTNEYQDKISECSFKVADKDGESVTIENRTHEGLVREMFRIHHAFAKKVDEYIFDVGLRTDFSDGKRSISLFGEIEYEGDDLMESGVFTYTFTKENDGRWKCYHRCFDNAVLSKNESFKKRFNDHKCKVYDYN